MPTVQGCLTCRLRRKKCSGEHPVCSRCTQLNVTCLGYGAKPLWMDGGLREKEGLEKIRKKVKLTTDGQRRSRALQGMRKGVQKTPSKDLDSGAIVREQGEPRPDLDQALTSPLLSQTLPNGSISDSQPLLPWVHDPQLESFLLMHYLDFVFPAQFPFYSPDASQGGRGWYLGLLMRSKPLYNAALTLAAYHHRKTSCCKDFHGGGRDGFEGFYSSALNGLRDRVGKLSKKKLREGLKDSIEVLACVVQLIMFDVARGGFEDWQAHLRATPDIHPFLETYCTDSSMRTISRSSRGDIPDLRDLSFIDHAAMEFFSSVILHLDILACASTGKGPQYADICAAALGDGDSKVRLDRIMGCENWIMVLIREIAVLGHSTRKNRQLRNGLSMSEMEAAKVIERRLDSGLEQLSGIRSLENGTGRDCDLAVRKITEVYTHGAKLYLQVVVSGPCPQLRESISGVSSTLAALRALPEPNLLRKTVWPFCIAGCMARVEHRQEFRELASAVDINPSVFGSSWKALEVMENCWRLRDEGGSVDWLGAMDDLGYRVLLV
ncbi:pestheic acid cluster transcriptional regulator 3 [Hyphodiscus hymeniophilus]|uniref:Pestheic acid cluster transcriptional regulator 3 n=1 Tax=Hyphodiscus hymeniophilus TaxID=353542 RepID=A0A9P6VP56_9HELO|nr:pestheic acid cluster transcriptional regulator 3 [Hyphodiscus hymeniophilus]